MQIVNWHTIKLWIIIIYLFPSTLIAQVIGKIGKMVASIDPGEKVPVAYYSLEEYGFIGEDVRIQILKIETKTRQYQRVLNKHVRI